MPLLVHRLLRNCLLTEKISSAVVLEGSLVIIWMEDLSHRPLKLTLNIFKMLPLNLEPWFEIEKHFEISNSSSPMWRSTLHELRVFDKRKAVMTSSFLGNGYNFIENAAFS